MTFVMTVTCDAYNDTVHTGPESGSDLGDRYVFKRQDKRRELS